MTWSGTNSGEVRGYKIYIGDEGLTQITAYTEVGEVRASTNFLITGDVFEDLDNLTTWYIAVSPFDDDRARVDVQTSRGFALPNRAAILTLGKKKTLISLHC